jgi:hypothetical protein
MIERSGSAPLTNRSGSGRREIRIRRCFRIWSENAQLFQKNREHSFQRRTIMDLTLSLVNFPNIMHFWRWLGNEKNTYSFSASAFHKNHTICKFCGSALASIQARIRSGSETLPPCVPYISPTDLFAPSVSSVHEVCLRLIASCHPSIGDFAAAAGDTSCSRISWFQLLIWEKIN